jgi:hypothetical protein
VSPPTFLESYRKDGYLVRRKVVRPADIETLLGHVLGLVHEFTGKRFDDAAGPEIADFLRAHPEVCGRVYDAVRRPPWLADFSAAEGVVNAVRSIMEGPISLLRKIPLRIDVPMEIKELAVWHQDVWYVRGSADTVTAWIPLQDTTYLNGCLLVMPGSHLLGNLDHDVTVLGKRHFPSGVFDREVRYVEMHAGDLLLFHSRLLHSSGLNLSSSIRFAVNARFAPSDHQSDSGMLGTIPLGNA